MSRADRARRGLEVTNFRFSRRGRSGSSRCKLSLLIVTATVAIGRSRAFFIDIFLTWWRQDIPHLRKAKRGLFGWNSRQCFGTRRERRRCCRPVRFDAGLCSCIGKLHQKPASFLRHQLAQHCFNAVTDRYPRRLSCFAIDETILPLTSIRDWLSSAKRNNGRTYWNLPYWNSGTSTISTVRQS